MLSKEVFSDNKLFQCLVSLIFLYMKLALMIKVHVERKKRRRKVYRNFVSFCCRVLLGN